MSDMGWSRYIADQETAHYAACFETAARHGHTADEAEACDDGNVGCPDCPFRKLEKTVDTTNLIR